jgi:hypothetical protein
MFGILSEALRDLMPLLVVVLKLAPIWLPIAMIRVFWIAWMKWRRAMFIAGKTSVVLEVRVPKEVNKSPRAMEVALNAFYALGGEGTWKDRYWKGGVRPWFSLEMVSIEGQVKFFVWTWKDHVKNIQNNIYAQYPTVEILEVDDYTMNFLYDKDKADIYAAEFGLSKPDAYPIKTYVDYGLDKDPKEEFKVDPITPVMEYLGGLGQGEQAWIQIIVRGHKAEDQKKGGIFAGIKSLEDVFFLWSKIADQLKPTDNWKDAVKDEIEKIVEKRKLQSKDPEAKGPMTLTEYEKDLVAALERSVAKLGFDTGVRVIYLGEKDKWNNSHKGAINGVLAQFNSPALNGFKKGEGTSFDYKYQDPFGWRLAKRKKEMFEGYRARGFFHHPHKRKWFVLNAEELATVFHFPGGVAATPTFGRIESRKAEPPTNLPV